MKTKSGGYKLFAVLSFFVLIAYAFYVNSFGTNADTMMKFFNTTESQQGFIFTIQSIGGLAVAIWLSLYGERYNKIYVMATGAALIGLGGFLIGIIPALGIQGGGYGFLLIFVALAGIGYTSVDVMVNGVITEVYPKTKDTVLPMAHAFFGVGAMIIPSLVALVVDDAKPSSFSIPFLGIGILALVVFGLFLFTGRKIMPTTPYAHMNDMRKRALENPAEIFKSPKAWLFLVTAILYFSFQYGMSIWMPTYFYYEKGFSHQSAAFMATVFFLGALVMRFLAPILFKKMALEKYYSIFAFLSAICTAIAFAVASSPLITFLIFMGGFFQGALIVAFVIICCREFPERTASASSLSVIAFNLSAMVMPVAVGAMAETKGFSLPMYLLVIGLVISIGSLWVAQKIASPKETSVNL